MGQHRLPFSPIPSRLTSRKMRPLLPLAVFFSVAYALSTPGLLKRTSEDTCAYLPAPVIIKLPGINEMISASGTSLTYFQTRRVGGLTLGDEATCLCVSQVPAFVNSKDFYVLMAVQEVGADAVAAALTSLVVSSSTVSREWGLTDYATQINTNEQCNYPENALSYCPANKPCSFTCTNGFTVSGNDCVCLPPNQACNGVCSATVTCPSSTSQQRREHNMWQKRTSCDVGFTACGSTGSYRKSIGAYECVDTRTDLESCTSIYCYSPGA